MITVESVNNYIRVIGTFDNVAKLFFIPKNTGRFDVVSNENFETYTGDWENRKHLGPYTNISLITRDGAGVAIEIPFTSFYEANEWFSKYLSGTPIVTTDGAISVQNPLPTDGDSVYCKDIDQNRSNVYNFSGNICIPFEDLHTIVKDVTSDSLKKYFVHFNRPVVTFALGLGNAEGVNNPDAPDFSNVKIIGLNSGETETILIDESTDNTKYTSRQFQFTPVGLNAIRFEFHTIDGVGITNISVQKSILATVRNLPTVLYAEQSVNTRLFNGASYDMTVDGSGTPIDFIYEATQLTFLERTFIVLTDGLTEFTSSKFGALNALTNGVEILIVSDGIEYPLALWKTNLDISLTMYDFTNPFKNGAYVGRWTFSKDTGEPYALRPGDKFITRIQDNLTGLDLFEQVLKGHL